MPEAGVPLSPKEQLLSSDEIVKLAAMFVKAGVTKIRLTGGEPLVRSDTVAIVGRLNELKKSGLKTIAMTTNGIVLSRCVEALRANGLDALNVSLDTLKPERFEQIARRKGWQRVWNAAHDAVRAGFSPLKLNCVVMRNVNDDELLDFVALTERNVCV